MDDLTLAIGEARQLAGAEMPLFLYGHSMGGLEVLFYGCQPERYKRLHRHRTLHQDRLHRPLQNLPRQDHEPDPAEILTLPTGLDVTALSRDGQVIKDYQNDPLVHGLASTRLGMFIIGGAEEVLKKASTWNHPLLLMHGTEDRLGIITGSEEFFSKISGDVTFKPWKGLYHELHNEPEKAQVIQHYGRLDPRLAFNDTIKIRTQKPYRLE